MAQWCPWGRSQIREGIELYWRTKLSGLVCGHLDLQVSYLLITNRQNSVLILRGE